MSGETPATVAKDPAAPETRGFVSSQIHRVLGDIRGGELGSWPIIIGLIIISAFFYYKSSNFLSGSNLNNLISQMAGVVVIAFGTVFVLLLGEIDLSAGFLSGVGGVVVGELTLAGSSHAYSGLVAIPIALAAGALYGGIQGVFVAYIGVPSFVVTLAGMLAAEGLILVLLSQGVIGIQDKWVDDTANYFFGHSTGWIVALIVSALYAIFVLSGRVRRRRDGAETGNLWYSLVKVAAISVAMFALVAWSNLDPDRGLPLAFIIMLVLYVFWNFIATRTTFGRHVYAVGGNDEAARRAGINVPRIKLVVFMISGMMAALGGVIYAARLNSVDINAGGGTILFDAIAGAVIGGTSLYGGRGRVKSAVLGVLLVYLIYNGLATIGYSTAVDFVVTGILLLGAVTLDTVSRRRQQKVGR
jgi:D-xylose transport system permease protein